MQLHHSGFVVADLSKYAAQHPVGELERIVNDPVQHARLALYRNHSNTFIEIIQPLNEQAFTWNALQKNGNHFHHFCYQVDTLEKAETIAASFRMLKVLGPVPAILFDGKDVVFYYSRNKQVVEFLIDPNPSI
jgi:methylmalonyl-CoA/ethylmalonyl-CoA epimerase